MKEDNRTASASSSESAADEPYAANSYAGSPRYEILEEHGRGGLGRVSRARDHELERDVAIKELIARGGTSEARFRREALITARLEHPGIVPVHEAGRWPNGTPYYAMKLVAGRPLRALIAERATVAGRLELLHHLIAVADAIAYAHGRGIIHRDLKPANIIVGDFGETVVIDWGLAKALGQSDDGERGGAVAPSPESVRDNVLTGTGMVLGTPAYMAPEQARGEAVDQRADVFALGAMLWELCALERVPPQDRRHRHGLLRHNGIDADLITILDKCLDPQAARRYIDAAGLAADLKAFKAGARIAARSYSLLAMLRHWARRNRRIALAVMAVITASVVGVVLYARDLAIERLRVEAANQRVILENARTLMTRDPTAAHELLQTYGGDDRTSLAVLQAEAVGRGVSTQHIRQDSAGVAVLLPALGGMTRYEISGRLSKLTAYGTVKPLLERTGQMYAQSDETSVIVHRCKEYGICLYDPVGERSLKAPSGLTDDQVLSVEISPNGQFLAALSASQLTIWRVAAEGVVAVLARATVRGGDEFLQVLNDGTVWIADADGISIHRKGAMMARIVHPGITQVGTLRATHRGDMMAFGSSTGEVYTIDPSTRAVVDSQRVCPEGLVFITPLVHGRLVGYVCVRDGTVGIWDFAQHMNRVLGTTFFMVRSSLDDRYLYVGKANGELLVYDAGRHVIRSLLGHASSITALAAPSPWYPYVATSDWTGSVRSWKVESTPITDEFTVGISFQDGFTALSDGTMIIKNTTPMIVYAPDGTRTAIAVPGALINHLAAKSSYGPYLARFGHDDKVRLWRFGASWNYQELTTGGREVREVVFEADPSKLITILLDGTIARWSLRESSYEVLQRVPEQLFLSRHCDRSERVILQAASGNVWLFDDRKLRWLGKDAVEYVKYVCALGGHWSAVAMSTGTVDVRNLDTHQKLTVVHGLRAISWIEFAADGSELAIASDDGIRIVRLPDPRTIVAALGPSSELTEIRQPEFVTYSPDNRWMAITAAHGAIWFRRRTDARWLFVSVGEATVLRGQFTSDSARFFVKDSSGKAHVIDMTAPMFR